MISFYPKRISRLRICSLILGWSVAVLLLPTGLVSATTSPSGSAEQPIIIITVDQLDAASFFQSRLPGIKKLLASGAVGLMNVRSSAGFSSASSFLSLGAGSRASYPPALFPKKPSFTQPPLPPLPRPNQIDSFLKWSFGRSTSTDQASPLQVAAIGWINNQARQEDHLVKPGLLGATLRQSGWQTVLIGGSESLGQPVDSGALLLMDSQGWIDSAWTGSAINELDPKFPFSYRFNPVKTEAALAASLGPRRVLLVEFGDLARLERYRSQISPNYSERLNREAWQRLDRFLSSILNRWSPQQVRLLLVCPAPPSTNLLNKQTLMPVVIRAEGFPPGLAESATTNWPGLVANLDLAPTVLKIADLASPPALPGNRISSQPISGSPIAYLQRLNRRLQAMALQQRPLLDWYLGIISTGWLLGWLLVWRRFRLGRSWCFTAVAVAPLILILMALLRSWSWQPLIFLGLTLAGTAALLQIKTAPKRWLVLTALLAGALIIDQFTGWQLIRFSALGYSAGSGSRYYGIGNECMGLLLAAVLVLTHLLSKRLGRNWPAWALLGLTIIVLGWPRLGANFGGLLAALVGFGYYLGQLYRERINRLQLGLVLAGGAAAVFLLGWWDSLRDPELQTHIGRFFGSLLGNDFNLISQIIGRKMAMNLKLIVFSPWTRVPLLALLIGIVNRFVTKQRLITPENSLLWRGLLVTGLAALVFNDSGVLAFGLCLAYGFSYLLGEWEEGAGIGIISKGNRQQ